MLNSDIMRGNFEFNGIDLSFYRLGSGSKVLLVFHGFGQEATIFDFFAKELPLNTYTIYVFDLFYHGEDKHPFQTPPLNIADWVSLMFAFFHHYQIQTFSCIGYSLGAKLVLPLLNSFASKIDHIWLIAPDGLQRRFWYNFSTKTLVGHYLLKQFLFRKVHFLFALLSILQKLGVLKVSAIRFIRSQINTPLQRLKLYYTWMVYRNLQINPTQIESSIDRIAAKTVFYLASLDWIFPIKGYLRWQNRLPKAHWEVRPVNHTQILKIALSEISSKLLTESFHKKYKTN